MCSFACMTAHLAAMGGTELTVNSKLRSDSWESVYKGPDYSHCKGCSRLQGSRTRVWAKVTTQANVLMPGEASGYSGAGANFLRFWRPTLCRFTVHREEKMESTLEVVTVPG